MNKFTLTHRGIYKYILLFLTVLSSFISFSQDARLSQIGTSALMLNPALSGRFDGQLKANSLFSWQKTERAFMSHQYFSIDYKLTKYKSLGDDIDYVSDSLRSIKFPKKEAKEVVPVINSKANKGYWSVGFNYYQYGKDMLGVYQNVSPLSSKFYSLTLSRHFYLKKNKFIGVGIQSTYARGNLNENVGNEYDKEISGGGFRYSNRNAAARVSMNDYFDYNIGAYYGMISDQFSFEMGLAMYHLFYPKSDIFILDNETKLRHRVTLYNVFKFKLSPTLGIVQKNIYWGEGLYWRSTSFYDSAHIISLWSGFELFKTSPKGKYNVNPGFYTRNFRTLMPMVVVNFGNSFNLKCSYEFPINSDKFNAYTAERSELSITYFFKRNTMPGVRFYKKFNTWQ